MAARVRMAGVTYTAFFNKSLRLVCVSKTAGDYFVGIKSPGVKCEAIDTSFW
jgi:hypothetical protein